MRIRIWQVLLAGFGALLILIGFSGFSALKRASGSYEGTTQLFVGELRTEQVLGRIRADILFSAVAVRDLLLMPSDSGDAKRGELRRLEARCGASAQELRSLIPAEFSERREKLERELSAYWHLLDAMNVAREPARTQLNEDLLRTRILPHREAVLTVIEQIEQLTRDSTRNRREDIDRRQADLPFYVSEVVGGTLLIGIIVAIVSLVQIAHLENEAARQHRAVKQAEEELRGLSGQLVKAQEEERRSLSRDLHDQIGQVLTAVRIGIGNLEESLHNQEPEVQAQLDQAKRLSEQALRSIRDIAMGLRPAMLDDLGLGAALEWQARQFSRLCDVPVSIGVEGDLEQLSEPQRTCIYRVIQEALNNAAKHSQATEIATLVTTDENGTSIRVRDNGRGFRMASGKPTGLGLVGIKERVRQLGGQASIRSEPGEGTVVSINLPRAAQVAV